jgi:hypothetical protein
VKGGAASYAANGVFGKHHVLVDHEEFGSVYAADTRDPSGGTYQEILPRGSTQGPDGLTLRGSRLYVIQNLNDEIAVYDVELQPSTGLFRASPRGCLTSPDCRTIATSAIKLVYIYATNSYLTETNYDAMPS